MSCSLWRWTEACDYMACPGDCDECGYEEEEKEVQVGDTIRIIDMAGEPQYAGRIGKVTHIDDLGQIHGTWGGCAIIKEEDLYETLR